MRSLSPRQEFQFGTRVAAAAERWLAPRGRRSLVRDLCLIGAMLALVTSIIYATGGTRLAYAHLAYIPILLGAFLFGVPGGVCTGLLAGLALGPAMPLDVVAGIPQPGASWIGRTVFFVLIGGFSGLIRAALAVQLEAVRRQGQHNPITSLPSRALLLEHLQEAVEGHRRNGEPVVVMALDLGCYDEIATTLGHDQADDLLRAAVRRLKEAMPAETPLYDLREGRFGLLLPGADYDRALDSGRRLLDALRRPFVVQGIPIAAEGRFGVARCPNHGRDGFSLLRMATAALRNACADGRAYALFDGKRDEAQRQAFLILSDLQKALRSADQLRLEFQPIIDLQTGACSRVEALLRWQHPSRGMVPPGMFIPLAETTALMKPLTEWVIGTSLRQLAAWQEAGIQLGVSVNVSIRNLEDPGFADLVRELAGFYGIEPGRLELEVTESALMVDPEAVSGALRKIRDFGVGVALDDFGTGQSSLAYLKDLPIDKIKLDQSFTRAFRSSARSRAVAETAIAIARKLGFKVVAEGIEDAATCERLRAMGCDLGQGYFISRPLSEPDLVVWLEGRQSNLDLPDRVTRLSPGRSRRTSRD